MTTRALIVGGDFNAQGGRPSKIMEQLGQATGWPVLNGGDLAAIQNFDFSQVDVLLWAPNIDNAEEKILPKIKAANPKLTLISTKRVVEKAYGDFEVISRLLKSRSNLGIKITKDGALYNFSLMDPLGNSYVNTSDINELGKALNARVAEMRALTRVGSKSVGPAVAHTCVDDKFIEIVKELGDEFSRHVNAVNPERFLGNASARPTDRITRCCHGFPAFRDNAHYMVSRRNVDKTTLSAADFVAVAPNEARVEFFGDVKPSVDSPIQIRLFNFYDNVRYIVHGHVYIDGAPVTHSRVPCGHVEEFDEINALFPDKNASNFAVNLKGHGCLILANDLEFLKKQKFVSRPFPEV